jgi:hypothetical protein
MKEFEILVIGKQPRIMETVARLINSKSRLNGSIAYTAEEAIAQSQSTRFHLVLIGAGLNEAESQRVRSFFTVPVVQHYGGGSGLLFAEISQALGINVAY